MKCAQPWWRGFILWSCCSLVGVGGARAAERERERDPLLEPPVVNLHPGPEYQDDVRAGAMIIGMDRTPKGRIWGCWTGTGDNHESYFILATSDDGGSTWSRPRVVIDPQEIPGRPPRYALIGNLWTDPTGRLWLFFDQHMQGFVQTDWCITCDNPDAAEPEWSAPVRLADGSTLNKPTVLKSGEWLLPVSQLVPGRTAASPAGAHVYVSKDRGRTWQRRGGVKIPEADTNHNEHMIVERRDGRLWMLLRTRYGIAETHSSDEGRTWSEPHKSAIENPSTRFFLRRLASGRLLLVKNGPIERRLPGRTHLTAYLSEDDGQTWIGGLLLDERNAVSYPDGFQAPNGLVQVLYDWNRHTDAEILLAAFREEDVLAGRLVSPDARLRHLVNKARAPKLSEANVLDRKRIPQATADATRDRVSIVENGPVGNRRVVDVLLRGRPEGAWSLHLTKGAESGSGQVETSWVTRTLDQGKSWTALVAAGESLSAEAGRRGLADVLMTADRVLVFLVTQSDRAAEPGRAWLATADETAGAWGSAEALPGRLAQRTALRNPLVTRAGRILVPFQHYPAALDDPCCGVLASDDGGRTWTEQGDIRLGPVRRQFAGTEANLVELTGGRIVMLIRQAGLMGLLYVAESTDGGRSWPAHARLQRAPTGGTPALFSLGGDRVAMVHNPSTKLALWVSFDGMKTWPYQRAFATTTCGGPKDAVPQPHGFVSTDRQWLHFAFVDAAQRAVQISAKLPPLK